MTDKVNLEQDLDNAQPPPKLKHRFGNISVDYWSAVLQQGAEGGCENRFWNGCRRICLD